MITDRIVDRIVQLEVMLMFMIFNADQARVVADFEGAVQCTSGGIDTKICVIGFRYRVDYFGRGEDRLSSTYFELKSKRRLLFLVNASYKPSACNNGSLCY